MNKKVQDSEIKWFGDIPKHWEKVRIKRAVKKVVGGAWGEDKKGDANDIPCVRIADFDRTNYKFKDTIFIVRNLDREKQKPFLLSPSDLLIEKSGGGETQPVGFVGQYHRTEPAIYTNFMAKLEIDTSVAHPAFLNFVFATLYSLGINRKSIKQTTGIQNLDVDSYLNELIVFPPVDDQKKIASFIEQKMLQIEQIISKTKESMVKHRAYKQTLIAETTTKGLKKDIPLKDCGFKWIGEMPEHWEVKKLQAVLVEKREKNSLNNPTVLSLTRSGIKIRDITTNEGQLAESYLNYNLVAKGDLLLNPMDLTSGANCNISEVEGVISPAYFNLNPRYDNSIYYYGYFFKTQYWNLALFAHGKGVSFENRWTLNRETLRNYYIPVPPSKEQKEIVSFLDKKTSQIDKVISDKEKLIENLESYKKSLIFEYVTGKKEVI